MKERPVEALDAIRIDCPSGDKYKTGKTPPRDPAGIQVGAATTTLVRKADHARRRIQPASAISGARSSVRRLAR